MSCAGCLLTGYLHLPSGPLTICLACNLIYVRPTSTCGVAGGHPKLIYVRPQQSLLWPVECITDDADPSCLDLQVGPALCSNSCRTLPLTF